MAISTCAHVPFNKYRRRIRRSDKQICQNCGIAPELTRQIILECERYTPPQTLDATRPRRRPFTSYYFFIYGHMTSHALHNGYIQIRNRGAWPQPTTPRFTHVNTPRNISFPSHPLRTVATPEAPPP